MGNEVSRFLYEVFSSYLTFWNFPSKHYLSDDTLTLINSNPDQTLKTAQNLFSKTDTSTT